MACHKFQKWLPLFIDSGLSERQKEQVSSHMSVCPECLREVQLLQQVVRLVGGMHKVQAPGDFYLRCTQRFECEVVPKPKAGIWLPFAYGSAGAAVVLLGLLVVPSSYWKSFSNSQASLLTDSRPALEAFPAQLLEMTNEKQGSRRLAFSLENQAVSAAPRAFRMLQSAGFKNAEDILPPPPGLAQTIAFNPGSGPLPANLGRVAPERESIPWSREGSGDYCAIREASWLLAKTSQQLEAIYAQTGIAHLSADIDWEQYMLVAIFAGQVTGGKAAIKVTDLHERSGALLIHYSLQRLEPAAGSGENYQPYLLLLLPQTPLPLYVQEN